MKNSQKLEAVPQINHNHNLDNKDCKSINKNPNDL